MFSCCLFYAYFYFTDVDHCASASLGDSNVAQPDGSLNEITVIVRDAPLESSDFSSVGVQTWGGSCILAEMIASSPHQFSIFPREDRTTGTPFRALELGAGTGLASLVLGKVLTSLRCAREHTHTRTHTTHTPHSATPDDDLNLDSDFDLVLATDMYPAALANLRLNFTVNFPPRPRPQKVPHTDDMGVRTLLPGQQHQLSEQHGTASQSRPGPRMEILPLDWAAVHQLMLTSALGLPVAESARISAPESIRGYRNEEEEATQAESVSVKPTLGVTLHASPITILPRETCANVHSDADTGDYVKVRGSKAPIGAGWVSLLQKESFDLIIGADIVYEREHAVWVRSCVERFLRRPDGRGDEGGKFHLVVPLRGTHVGEVGCVEDVWRRRGSVGAYLAILSKEDIVCDAYRDRGEDEEVVYRYYKIGWV